jgi:signal peptidase II
VGDRRVGYAIALAIFVADQITKWIVIGPLSLQIVGQIEIVPFFNLTWVENYGISLGLFEARSATGQWILIALTSAIAIGVAYWIGRERARWDKAALGMILGGAIGNILDRLRYGYVADFADLNFSGWPEQLCWSYYDGACRPFLVFNVADAAISIGVAILLLRAFLVRDQSPEESVKNA